MEDRKTPFLREFFWGMSGRKTKKIHCGIKKALDFPPETDYILGQVFNS